MTDEVTYHFTELDVKVQQKIIDDYREGYQLDWNWWEGTYEHFKGVLEALGFSLTYKDGGAGRADKPAIWFSGFSSQGDGASFAAKYRYIGDVSTELVKHTEDATILKIAEELALLQIKNRMLGVPTFSAVISTTSGMYVHSNTMDAEADFESDADIKDEWWPILDQNAADIRDIARRLADWLYKELEAEHDYLLSDESIEQYVNCTDYRYTVDGELITD